MGWGVLVSWMSFSGGWPLCCLLAVIPQHDSTAALWSNKVTQAWEKWGSPSSDTASMLKLFWANYFSLPESYLQLTCICKNRCVLSFQVLLTNSFMELAVSDPNGPVRATEKLAITRERPESTAVRFLQQEVGEHPLYYSTFHWYGWEVYFFPPWTCTSLH